jgi:hypothetical protein
LAWWVEAEGIYGKPRAPRSRRRRVKRFRRAAISYSQAAADAGKGLVGCAHRPDARDAVLVAILLLKDVFSTGKKYSTCGAAERPTDTVLLTSKINRQVKRRPICCLFPLKKMKKYY